MVGFSNLRGTMSLTHDFVRRFKSLPTNAHLIKLLHLWLSLGRLEKHQRLQQSDLAAQVPGRHYPPQKMGYFAIS